MHTVNPQTVILSIAGTAIKHISLDWQETLRTVTRFAQRSPGVPTDQVCEAVAKLISEGEGKPLTLASICIDALLGGKSAEECAGCEKLQRWELALKFRDSATFELDYEQIKFVDGCLALAYKASVYGPASDALKGVTR